jgi:ribosomal protein S3
MSANVTIKLEESLVKQARKQALEADCSLSGWVALLIQENLKKRADYRSAKSRALQRMADGFDLSSGRLTREQLHER